MRTIHVATKWVRYYVAVVAAIAFAFTARHATFVPWGTDSAAYADYAQRLVTGELITPSELPLELEWARDGWRASALGHRPGPHSGTDVSIYPIGYPMLMALGRLVGGEKAEYLVGPVAASLVVIAASALAEALGGAIAGAIAATLAGASPATVVFAILPMSDLPAAAMWLLALRFAVTERLSAALASGALTALAITIRPNLAPLAAVLALGHVLIKGGQRRPIRDALAYCCVSSVGVIVVAWSQASLYGHVFESGYPGVSQLFSTENVWPNIKTYISFLSTLHSPLLTVSLAAPWALRHASNHALSAQVGPVPSVTMLFIFINILLYLPYKHYEDIHFVRFLLPAVIALLVLFAVVVAVAARELFLKGWPVIAGFLLLLLPCLLNANTPAFLEYATSLKERQERVALLGQYLSTALPRHAVVFSNLQSGAVSFYTDAPIVRWDLMSPQDLSSAIADLVARSYEPVFVVDQSMELQDFVTKLGKTLTCDAALASPRAVATDAAGRLLYFSCANISGAGQPAQPDHLFRYP